MRWKLIVLLYLIKCLRPSDPLMAQRQADNWMFGQGVGLAFSSGKPIPLSGNPMDALEGVATISDMKTGQLLFYSDGVAVWNRNNQIMPNGQDLLGGRSSTQSSLIVPFPGRSDLYYLFTVRAYNDTGDKSAYGGMYYSLVDMNLNNGLGDVVASSKNKFVELYTTEKLTAIPHANKRDYWVLSHAWNSNEFLVYLLTPSGLSLNNRIPIGTIHKAGPPGNSEAMGYLKASPNGKHLAAAVYGDLRPFELYDFNNQTGNIHNYRNLGNFTKQYGVSFSPDNTKLYLSCVYQFDGTLNTGSYQFNLNDKSYKAVELTIVDSTKSSSRKYYVHGSLQLGIDKKLYASTGENGRLIVINYPNLIGTASNPQYINISSKNGTPLLGLPNFIQDTFNYSSTDPNPREATNEDCIAELRVYPNPITENLLTVEFENSGCILTKLVVYDVSGRLIMINSKPLSKTLKFNVSNWSSGLYFFVFEFTNQRVVKKMVKV